MASEFRRGWSWAHAPRTPPVSWVLGMMGLLRQLSAYEDGSLKGEHAQRKLTLSVKPQNASLHTASQLLLSLPVGTCLFHGFSSNSLNGADRSSIQLMLHSSLFHWEQMCEELASP